MVNELNLVAHFLTLLLFARVQTNYSVLHSFLFVVVVAVSFLILHPLSVSIRSLFKFLLLFLLLLPFQPLSILVFFFSFQG
jgi:hypothetical protein